MGMIRRFFWRLSGKRAEERDRLRQLVHGLRRHVTPEEVQDVRETCARYALPSEEVGTTAHELVMLEREGYRLKAAAEVKRMRDGTHDPGMSVLDIFKWLELARLEHKWDSIGTTWEELARLHKEGLLQAARAHARRMARKEQYQGHPISSGMIQALLILACPSESEMEELGKLASQPDRT